MFGGGQVQAQMFSPPQAALDPNMAVMLLIAVCTVALGGYWSGACERWGAARLHMVSSHLHTGSSHLHNESQQQGNHWPERQK